MRLPDHSTVTIVGGGVSGLTCALQLQQIGVQSCVIERDTCGAGSSNAAGGILFPLTPWLYTPQLVREVIYSNQLLPPFLDQLQRDTGIDPQCISSGICFLDSNPLEKIRTSLDSLHVNMVLLSARELTDCTGQLAPGFQSGLYIKDIYQINPPKLMQALYRDCAQKQIPIIEHCAAHSVQASAGDDLLTNTSQGPIHSGAIVVCLGAWSQNFLLESSLDAPMVYPVRGQLVEFAAPPATLKTMLVHNGFYLIPRQNGRIIAGSTLEEVGFDDGITSEAREQIIAHAVQALPALADCEITSHWAGLRPGSDGNQPHVGQHASMPRIWLNYGHHRYGFALALQSARQITEGIQRSLQA